jgi:glycosyltransferase involved in cell wall biosynthesis
MRVGVVADQYVSHDGGAYTFQAEVLAALSQLQSESRHEFMIFSKSKPSADLDSLAWRDYPSPGFFERVLFRIARTWPALKSRLKLRSSLERAARNAGVEFLWFLSPRIQTADLPYMTIVLDLQHRLQPWFPEVSTGGEWESRERHYVQLLGRAAAIIVGTEAGKEEVQAFYKIPAERIHILPHPTPRIELPSRERQAETLHKFALQSGFLFYPAQFWTHKNHVNLLKALAVLRSQGLTPQTVFTGSDFGNLKGVQATVRKLGLGDQVKIIGFVERDELIALYQNALALTYVSYFGPENLPPLEAFACGCPVLAADVHGAREQLGAAALLVDPSDPAAIAAGIAGLLEDEKLRADLAARGRERAAQWTAGDFVAGAFKIIDQFSARGIG